MAIPCGDGSVSSGRLRIRYRWNCIMNDHLKELKKSAKAIARARRISHIGALEIVATSLGYPHWNALIAAEKKGWRPREDEVLAVRAVAQAENPLFGIEIPPEIALGDRRPSGEVMGH